MTSSEVRALVEAEIGGEWDRVNPHGVDLAVSVVEPRRVRCRNTFPKLDGGAPLDLWLVLEEVPGSRNSYVIVFDERNGKFGLGVWSSDEVVFIGYHGTFMETLDGM
jgi:hypothetical protein